MNFKVLSSTLLDGFEKLCCAHGNWITIAHVAHLKGNDLTLLNNGPIVVQYLLKRHSNMRTRLRIDANQYFIDILEYDVQYLSSELFFSAAKTTTKSWQEFVEEKCNQDPYSNNGTIIFPLFHFMLLFGSDQYEEQIFHLILFQNHCVSDGRSGYILINDFLTLATDKNLFRLVEPLNNEIYPLISQIIPRPYGIFYSLVSYLTKQKLKYEQYHQQNQSRIPVKSIPLTQCVPSKFNVQRYKIKFLFASTTNHFYENLRKQCHLHNVTINGLLFSCLLLSIHHCFPLKESDQLKPYEISVSFDMRSRVRHPSLTSSSVGFFSCGTKIKLSRCVSTHSMQFWSFARQCMITTRNQLKPNGIPLRMSMVSDIFSDETQFEEFTRNLPNSRRSEFAYSNIGKYPFPCEYNQGEIRLHGLHVINNTSLYRFSTVLFITCAGNNQIDLSLAHEMENNEKAKEFLDYYTHLIEASANPELCKTKTTLEQLMKAVETSGFFF